MLLQQSMCCMWDTGIAHLLLPSTCLSAWVSDWHLRHPSSLQTRQYKAALESQLPRCNEHLIAMPHINSKLSGSTAITAILEGNGMLTVANVGDSRCLLGRVQDDRVHCIPLNTDHTPDVPAEASRILSNKVYPLPQQCHEVFCLREFEQAQIETQILLWCQCCPCNLLLEVYHVLQNHGSYQPDPGSRSPCSTSQ